MKPNPRKEAMQTPLSKSKTDAMFLRMVANEFEHFQPIISKVTEGKFCFTAAALKVIADKLEREGYSDDAPSHDPVMDDLREKIYGDTLAYERAKALGE